MTTLQTSSEGILTDIVQPIRSFTVCLLLSLNQSEHNASELVAILLHMKVNKKVYSETIVKV